MLDRTGWNLCCSNVTNLLNKSCFSSKSLFSLHKKINASLVPSLIKRKTSIQAKKNLQTMKRRRDKTIEQQAATIIAQLPSMQCNNDRIIATGGVQHLKKGVCSKSKPRTTWWLQKGDFLVGTKNTSHESWFTYLTLARDAHQLHNESSTQGRRGEDAMEFCKGCTPAAQWKSSTPRGWRSEAGSMVTLWGGEGRPHKTLDPKTQNQVRVCSKIAPGR